MAHVAMVVGGAVAAVSGPAMSDSAVSGAAVTGAVVIGAALEARPGRNAPAVDVEWLAPAVRVGRNELQIARFRADRPPQRLLDDLTADWSRRPAPIQRSAEGGWLVAIQADGDWVETVRVRADDGGAAGLRIRQRLAPPAPDGDAPAVERLLPRARVVNRTDQDGAGRRITSWVLVSDSAPEHLLAVARVEARRGGFTEDTVRAQAGGPLWLRRRGEELVITTTAGGEGAVAVVHWSRKP